MPSLLGAALSILFVVICAFYAVQKFQIVAKQSKAIITAAEHESFYTQDDQFGAD